MLASVLAAGLVACTRCLPQLKSGDGAISVTFLELAQAFFVCWAGGGLICHQCQACELRALQAMTTIWLGCI